MGKHKGSSSGEGKPAKVKKEKQYTRMQAERAISSGTVAPEKFLDMKDPLKKPDPKQPGSTSNHANYHVRAKAWKKMGMPIPDGWLKSDREKFFESIHYREPAPMGAAFLVFNPPTETT